MTRYDTDQYHVGWTDGYERGFRQGAVVNLNDECWVQLTEAGLKHYFEMLDSLGVVDPIRESAVKGLENATDEKGWTKFVLHDLMYTFGEIMIMGTPPSKLPFKGNVVRFTKP